MREKRERERREREREEGERDRERRREEKRREGYLSLLFCFSFSMTVFSKSLALNHDIHQFSTLIKSIVVGSFWNPF